MTNKPFQRRQRVDLLNCSDLRLPLSLRGTGFSKKSKDNVKIYYRYIWLTIKSSCGRCFMGWSLGLQPVPASSSVMFFLRECENDLYTLEQKNLTRSRWEKKEQFLYIRKAKILCFHYRTHVVFYYIIRI